MAMYHNLIALITFGNQPLIANPHPLTAAWSSARNLIYLIFQLSHKWFGIVELRVDRHSTDRSASSLWKVPVVVTEAWSAAVAPCYTVLWRTATRSRSLKVPSFRTWHCSGSLDGCFSLLPLVALLSKTIPASGLTWRYSIMQKVRWGP